MPAGACPELVEACPEPNRRGRASRKMQRRNYVHASSLIPARLFPAHPLPHEPGDQVVASEEPRSLLRGSSLKYDFFNHFPTPMRSCLCARTEYGPLSRLDRLGAGFRVARRAAGDEREQHIHRDRNTAEGQDWGDNLRAGKIVDGDPENDKRGFAESPAAYRRSPYRLRHRVRQDVTHLRCQQEEGFALFLLLWLFFIRFFGTANPNSHTRQPNSAGPCAAPPRPH